MSLIVEDGSGLEDAESYVSVSDADDYHANRGNTLWSTMTADEKEEALRRATDAMTQLFRESWAGYRKTSTQALDWPRYEVPRRDTAGYWGCSYYDENSVPREVVTAACEMAFRAAQGELLADIGPQKIRTKIGPIETEYAPFSRQSTLYRAVEMILRPLMRDGGGPNSIRVVRS